MADFNQPTNSSLYTDVLSILNNKIASVSKLDYTGDTNVHTGAWRLNSTSGLLETWSGSAWTIQGYVFKATATGTAQFAGALQFNATSAPTWDTGFRIWGESGWGARYDGYQHRWDVGLSRTEALRITFGGNVGIGVSSPTDRLHVNGSLKFEAVSAPTWDSSFRLWTESGWGSRYDGFQHRWDVGASRTEAMRIASNGNVLIAKTSSVVTGSGSYFTQGGSSTNPALLVNTKTTSGTVLAIQNHHNGTYVGGVSYDNTSTSFPTSSDYRLKENVEPLTNGLDRLMNLQPVRFNFVSQPGNVIDGFLAHEVAAHVPNAVSGEKDAVNEDGSIRVQALDHSKLVPLLTAAIKELTARVEALEAE